MELEKKLRESGELPDECIARLMENTDQVSFASGEVIVNEGSRNGYVYFVEKGAVRGYVLRNGKEVTLFFGFEGDRIDTGFGPVCPLIVETLEQTRLWKISRSRLEKLCEKSPQLANWGRRAAERKLSEYERYFTDYFWADKGTQYLILLRDYPGLLQRVSLKSLASYLNVTPQSLSRIRARLR